PPARGRARSPGAARKFQEALTFEGQSHYMLIRASHEDIHPGGTMPQRGDIVVERLTGKRAIVIHVNSPQEGTCPFAGWRLEDRNTCECDPVLPFLGSILSFVIALFVNSRERPGSVAEQVRPLLLRRAAS